VSIENIRDLFGERVANFVWAVTGIGKNRKERMANILEKIPTVQGSNLLKLADRLSNVSSTIKTDNHGLFKMYQKEHDVMKTIFPVDNILFKELENLMNMKHNV